MLKQLHIQNIAVIQKANVMLTPGLNVFTGETGAGKTILISAIDAVLGERASKDMIRTGEEKAQVTALFEDISPLAVRALEELGYSDDEGSVLISREIHLNGKGSCKINGVPATVSILKEIASLLISIHGQRDSAQLLAGEQHLRLIDAFGDLGGDMEEYHAAYRRMCDIREELESLKISDSQKAQRIDMLTFQIAEIEAAGLEDPEEEGQLQAQKKLIKNSEKVRDALSAAYTAIQGAGETEGIGTLIDALADGIALAADFIAPMEPMSQRISEMRYELEEYAQDIRNTLEDFEFDPRELDAIESRLDTIYKLRRKYGDSIGEILSYCDKARVELEAITTSEQRARELTVALESATATAESLAAALSEKRRKAAQGLVLQVEEELAFLDMPSVRLSIRHQAKPLSERGTDEIEFYIVTNVGESPKPLSKIASGGEMSRIMLAIKNVLAEKDDVATLIFDEVDTGVSGRAAQKIGRKLAQVARARQVVCVTHLAQVAAFADNHLLIRKEIEAERTFTRITALDEEEIVAELARITNGDLVTDAALKSAGELRASSRGAFL